ncbi:MAG: ATP-binding cassette domain-containing protein [Actinomycetia bacterium]|nr:ATP-binding cassette domain-containing protein [Actinomycetes bacterium]MCP4223440.1 ATP-binding cassette domain-containing protein [Actinomycetes bacterium]MCP5034219.1 ATP-binding cassette domain-containing protein [Actinomycetes bacterium]
MLSLHDVGVTIGGRPILADLSWSVHQGQHWVVVGPNGGGKSTMLRVAALALHPTVGTVCVLGHELGRVDIRSLRGRIGVSSAALTAQIRPNLTAEEIVRCGRFGALEPWWHHYEPTDQERAGALLAQVGLDGYDQRPFATLSSGERQRVMLARTMMPNPDLILLDEPTAGLDFGGREELLDALHALAAEPLAPPTVVVTHRVEDIPETTTHILAVVDGKSVAMGPIAETLTSAMMSQVFGLDVELTRIGHRWTARTA